MTVARRFLSGIATAARAEEDRWPLWLPVALGLGAAGYFGLAFEPPGWSAFAAIGLAMGGTALSFLPRAAPARTALALLALLALGFGLAKLRERAVATPVLDRKIIAHLTGRIESAEARGRGVRVVLGDLHSGAFRDRVPARARIAFAKADPLLAPGVWIGVMASLMPPPGPAMPGASDFARTAFFQRIGAAGFAYGTAYPGAIAGKRSLRARMSDGIEILRERMAARIQAVLPGPSGAIGAALVTGLRGGITDEDEGALRDAGLAHVLAIAGLHMALVGGGLFWLARALLAASPRLALHYAIKKWAAVIALLGAGFYLVISGAAPPAVRAFVMLACAFLAVLVDRPALSMRSLALAAAILIVLRPETITEPGFQMSFAAVAALIAVAEWQSARHARNGGRRGVLWRYVQGIAVTSLVGSLATLPFALFHFDRVTHYAVLGNLLAMPVMGLVVMPCAALGVAAMPLGWDAVPFHAMGWGIDAMLAIGRFVSGLPGAVTPAPAAPMVALVLVTFGGLWLALWRKAWRWWGLVPVLAGLALALTAPAPDILIGADARTVALRGADGRLYFLGKPADKFAARVWLTRNGEGGAPQLLPGLHCDGEGCAARAPDGIMVAAGRRAEALLEDCGSAAIVVNAAADTPCPNARQAIGPRRALFDGGDAVMFTPWRVISARDFRGHRPWVAQ